MKLKNKVALITGASKGIGEGIAEVFAKEGANLILCARSASTKQIADTLAEKYNIKAIYVNCDVTKKRIVKMQSIRGWKHLVRSIFLYPMPVSAS